VKLRPYVFLTDEERAAGCWAERALVLQSSGLGGRMKMLNKEWRPERFQEVAKHFQGQMSLVQIGSPADPPIEGARDLRGRTSTRETAAVLANAAAFVGLVGFPMHLARAVDCPSVIVYGGREHPDQSGYSANENLYTPVDCSPCWQWQTCDHDRVCMTSIRTETVVAAVEQLLARPRRPLAVDEAVI
jgi:ADP-heptose:LPS heptosyltransferase